MVETKIGYDPNELGRAKLLEGEDPLPEDFPVTLFEDYADGPIDDLPKLFIGGGCLTFTKELAAPFFEFDLGRWVIAPVRIFRHDRKTEIFSERGYHSILANESFSALAPEFSPRLRPSKGSSPPTRWGLPWGPLEDGDIAVRRVALDSPVLWGDRALYEGPKFFNGELVKAMRRNGTGKYWNLTACKIVDTA